MIHHQDGTLDCSHSCAQVKAAGVRPAQPNAIFMGLHWHDWGRVRNYHLWARQVSRLYTKQHVDLMCLFGGHDNQRNVAVRLSSGCTSEHC